MGNPWYRIERYLKLMQVNKAWLTVLLKKLETAKAYEISKSGLVFSPADLENEINGFLIGSEYFLPSFGVSSGILGKDYINLAFWAPRVTKSLLEDPQTWTSLAVDVDIGGTTSSLTIAQDVSVAIFDVFDVGDVVEITQAEDPDHNGFHTVSARTSSPNVLTFNATMNGSNNADDTSMVIELIER